MSDLPRRTGRVGAAPSAPSDRLAAAADPPGLAIGVLASQGGFAAHARMLSELEARTREVRTAGDLDGLNGLVIPGGESTTIAKALRRDGLETPIREFAADGGAVLGTCAGMILLDREHLGLVDALARRNAFGRQRQSFEQELAVEGIGPEPLRAVFIRAPRIEEHGEDVDVLARLGEHPVVVRQGRLLACAFHPELTEDSRLHALFMAIAASAAEQDRGNVASIHRERSG